MKTFIILPLALFNAVSAFAQTTAPANTPPAGDVTTLDPITVTGTRERALLSETPASIGTVSADSVRETAPLHPGQILGQIPGVAIAVTNGEGHTTAIRQPFTTSPVYLFLEDGIPIRATGFFNHNALYEVNLPMAGGIEVVRGPGTALYGSDAIGGIINVLSRAPVSYAHGDLSGEYGSFGSWRGLASGGSALGERGAFQADLNATHTDGWRDRTAYDRRSANLRFDQTVGRDDTLKTLVAVSHIAQQTGANSPLPLADYLHNPTLNRLPIAYRNVSAVRISTEYEHHAGDNLLSFIPYFRDDAMELNGSYNLSFDPRIERTHNVSYGLMAKWRRKFIPGRTRLIAGIDFDYSPGSRQEDNLLVTRTGSGATAIYSDYRFGTRIYDYRVTFQSLSPYVHTEFSPTARLRLTAGLRYDLLDFAMSNHLPSGTVAANVLGATKYYGQIAADDRSFSRASPKLGATYTLTPHLHLYTSYNFGFRVPSESQLYRAGNDSSAANAQEKARLGLALQPIKARQFELGVRGEVGAWSYNLVGYDLVKRDDLVSQRDLATNVTVNVNAGRTDHRGVEAGLGGPLMPGLRIDTALSYSNQRYINWATSAANYSGHDIEAAPHVLANTRLTWRPAGGAMVQLEWVRVGAYWLEASNSPAYGKYPGHDLLNLRATYAFNRRVTLFGRLMNATNKRFADSASVSSSTPVFSPGLPRAAYGGVEVKW
ncbi:TonB-dependent receptor [Horticoccus luteus]|uniref:TonB-dependent receptor n=1 Tax=Horticoccus luteus TaxID=2862869 RepID=A0A8F9TVQ5_9BACT|nr:TonB-dependent receptor [Horticoccus luteus]QYM78861.1 TonB-dependent receptor [Horticoccus luteus]